MSNREETDQSIANINQSVLNLKSIQLYSLTKKMLEIRSADILAWGGSSLPIVCRLCFEHELSSLTSASQCRSTVLVSRMHDVTRVTQISITD